GAVRPRSRLLPAAQRARHRGVEDPPATAAAREPGSCSLLLRLAELLVGAGRGPETARVSRPQLAVRLAQEPSSARRALGRSRQTSPNDETSEAVAGARLPPAGHEERQVDHVHA